ncbi:hypothetical protein [Marinomonas transparens]|nr:hypothetical protein [Marinomonas transparens]
MSIQMAVLLILFLALIGKIIYLITVKNKKKKDPSHHPHNHHGLH